MTPASLRERLLAAALLAVAWVLVRALDLAAVAGVTMERFLARGLVLAFTGVVLFECVRAAGPRVRRALGGGPARVTAFAALTVALAIAYAFAARAVRLQPTLSALNASAWAAGSAGYGPLTVWPAVEFAWPALGLVGHVTLGRALLLGVSGALSATLVVLVAARVRDDARRAGAACGVMTAAPALAGACPVCGPPVLALAGVTAGGAAFPFVARALATPTSLLVTVLDVLAPLALLAAVLALSPSSPRPRGPPALPRPVVALALGAPFAFAGLVRVTPAVAWWGEDAPSSAQELIGNLFFWVTVGGVILSLAALVPLVYFVIKYRYREGVEPSSHELPRRTRRALSVAYVAVPAVIIFALGVYSSAVLDVLTDAPEGTFHVDVTGTQFAWYFLYPDGNVTMNDLVVPANEVVVLHVTSVDVIHSFFVPDLGVKIDANPGMVNDYWFRSRNPGTYQAHCAEFCGMGHAGMLATVTVAPSGGADAGGGDDAA